MQAAKPTVRRFGSFQEMEEFEAKSAVEADGATRARHSAFERLIGLIRSKLRKPPKR